MKREEKLNEKKLEAEKLRTEERKKKKKEQDATFHSIPDVVCFNGVTTFKAT